MQAMSLSFRDDIVSSGNFAEIADLHTRSWQRSYRGILSDAYLDNVVAADHLKKWQERFRSLENTQDFICIARNNGQLIGFLYAVSKRVCDEGILLNNLHVDPLYHKHGIGRRLMAEVGKWMEPRDAPLYLEVFAANKPAMAFYDRCGGKKIKEFIEQLPDGGKTRTVTYQWEDPSVLVPAAL
jgi:GNAT superfamily N-acetyltransferase